MHILFNFHDLLLHITSATYLDTFSSKSSQRCGSFFVPSLQNPHVLEASFSLDI
ncbi:hypothetical protein KC19_6G055400 [Ceratodon purpureus]|uniref:Uncharacterized protein n=1 Tax=Ceratodon purpureus TaxID=3225 RepID=A0A8T0HCG6_CERPU|nr:hypothetical protein KC19_6G055400 [Ceratodon purpureus]